MTDSFKRLSVSKSNVCKIARISGAVSAAKSFQAGSERSFLYFSINNGTAIEGEPN